MPSLCRPIPVCPLSVVCVHGLYMSTVHFHTHTHTSLARSQCFHSAGQFLCVHCQWCGSTVCICPLFTFTHTHLTSTLSMLSLCWPIPVCPLSVLCVHGLYMSTVHFHTHTTELARSECLLSAGPFLCVHFQWCVSTFCICPLFTFTHTHLTSTLSMLSLCWPIPVCPLSVLCVHGLYMSTVHFHTHTT